MGKNLIIHFDELSKRYNNSATGDILALFELTANGAKDISHRIFGNVAGENILIPKDRVTLSIVTHRDSNGEIYSAFMRMYEDIHNLQDGRSTTGAGSTLGNLLSNRLSDKDRSSDWKKDTDSNSAKEYLTKFFKYSAYTQLPSSYVACICHPDDMREEELAEILEIYGGIESFDVRPFLFDEQESSDVLRYVYTSRSYVLPQPVIIPIRCFQTALRIAYPLIADMQTPRKVLDRHGITESSSLYKAIRCFSAMGKAIGSLSSILDVSHLLINARHLIVRMPEGAELTEDYLLGWESNPDKRGRLLKYEEVLKEVRERRSIESANDNRTFYSGFVDNELSDLELALVKSATRTANSLVTVVNSTVYLTKDLLWMLSHDAEENVRWKGSRKEQEKVLTGTILVLNRILSTPPLVKKLLRLGTFLGTRGRGSSPLPHLGAMLRELTGRPNTLELDISSLLEEKATIDSPYQELPQIHFKRIGWGRTDQMSNFLSLYILTRQDVYLIHSLRMSVSELENICTNQRVQNSLEAGFQVPYPGKMFISSSDTRLSDGFVRRRSYSSELSISGTIEGTLLHSIKTLIEVCLENNLSVSDEIVRIKACVQTLIEIKSNIHLKAVDFSILDSDCRDVLNLACWDRLEGNK